MRVQFIIAIIRVCCVCLMGAGIMLLIQAEMTREDAVFYDILDPRMNQPFIMFVIAFLLIAVSLLNVYSINHRVHESMKLCTNLINFKLAIFSFVCIFLLFDKTDYKTLEKNFENQCDQASSSLGRFDSFV